MSVHINRELINAELNKDNNEFRWYLCKQERADKWECKRVPKADALDTTLKGDVTAIPVSAYVPTFCDPAVIHHALHPHIRIMYK